MQLSLSQPQSLPVRAGLIFTFAALTALAAQLEVPMIPVPMTMQTCVVLLAGVLLGVRAGALSQVVYLAAGLALPVYAGGASGAAVLFGATGGYLLSFPIAAALAGLLVTAAPRVEIQAERVYAMILISSVPILLLGSVWLKLVLGISWETAWAQGVMPFIFGDLVKCGVTTAAVMLAASLRKK